MFAIFQSVVDRLKAMFAADAALDFEAQFVSRHADRKADLLRKAAEFEKEGLKGVAQDLRAQADALCIRRPLDAILPAAKELSGESRPRQSLSDDGVSRPAASPGLSQPLLAERKIARRRRA